MWLAVCECVCVLDMLVCITVCASNHCCVDVLECTYLCVCVCVIFAGIILFKKNDYVQINQYLVLNISAVCSNI